MPSALNLSKSFILQSDRANPDPLHGGHMESYLLMQGLFNGLMLGMFYALIALGLSLIFGIMGIVNFAHGEMYMMGGYIAYYFTGQLGMNFFVALVAAILFVGFIGIILEKGIFRHLAKRPRMEVTSLIAALGLAWIFQILTVIFFGELDKNVPSAFTGIIRIAGVTFTSQRIAAISIGAVLILLLNLFLLRTKTGMAIRAVSQEEEGAVLQGVQANRINALSFGIGCSLAGAAGVLMSPIFGINPFSGHGVILKAFLVVILGGMGSIPGALLGGLILGIIESFGNLFFRMPVVSVLTFVIILAILIFKPEGLMGRA